MEDQNITPGPKRASRRTATNMTAASPPASTVNDTRPASADQGRGIVDRVRERASAGLATQKDRATDGLGSVAQAVRQSTQQLRDQKHDVVAQYVEQAAEQIERFSNRIRQKDVGEIIDDAQRLARRRPALFIGGAFALGLVGARFLKSSPPDRGRDEFAYGTGRSFDDRQVTGRSVGTITGTSRDNPGAEIY